MTNKFRILIEEKKAAAVSKRGPRVYEKPVKKPTAINWRTAKPEEKDAHLVEKKWKEQERALGRAAKYC